MNKIQILIVCRQSKVLFAKGCVRGAHNSRHSHSVALAKRMNNESGWLAQIIYFVECVVPKTGTSNQHFTTGWQQFIGSWIIHTKYGMVIQHMWPVSYFPGHSYILVTDTIPTIVYTK